MSSASVRPRRALLATVAIALGVAVAPAPTPAAAQAPGAVDLTRISADDRYATAAAIARDTFPSAATVFVARGDGAGFADALAANYAAGVAGVPVLLSQATSVPAATLDAITALGAQAVHLLGGTGALGAEVETTLRNRGLVVNRVSGADRFATAAALARSSGPAAVGVDDQGRRTAVLSSGRSFPDALAAGGIVYSRRFPQLLTEPNAVPAVSVSALLDLDVQHVIITGGPSAISTAVDAQLTTLGLSVERVSGETRYDTAVALADMAIGRFGFGAAHVDVATGEAFPDALAGGPHGGARRVPLILTQPGAAHPAACGFVQRRNETLVDGHVFGGPTAVSDAVVTALESGCAAPVGGRVIVDGHGFGHGRGLGQWGANGYAANAGWNAGQILQHFYGNTTAGAIDLGTTISVRLIAQDNATPRVTSGQPFTVGGVAFAAGDAAWVTRDATGWTLHASTAAAGGGCGGAETAAVQPVLDPTFTSSVPDPGNTTSSMLALCDGGGGVPRYYRGQLRSALDSEGPLRFVNVLPMEQYLRGVVPRESPASWPAAALQSQAVAARSYAASEARYSYAQTCDTTSCQVYNGAASGTTRLEHDNTDDAITATAGQVRRMPDNSTAHTEFSASTGGWTAGGTFPSVIDEGDAIAANPNRNWSVNLDAAEVGAKYSIGTATAVEVIARSEADGGRRATRVRITGSAGSIERTGEQFRSDWALKSSWFTTSVTGGS